MSIAPSPRPAVAPAPEWRAWLTVAILLLLAVLASIDRNAIALMVDPIKQSLGLSDARMGLLQGPAFAVFFLIGSMPMGWLVDHFSRRWTIYAGVTVWSLATVACGLAGSFTELLVARCVVGFGEAVLQPAGWSMVARLFPPQRLALAIGVLGVGAQIGAAASYLLGGLLIAEADRFAGLHVPLLGELASWQWVFVIAGVPGIVAALLIFLAPEPAHERPGPGSASVSLRGFVRDNRAFLGHHFLGFSLHAAAVFGAAAWLPSYLMRQFTMDVGTVGLVMALAAVPVGMAGVIFNGWWVDRRYAAGQADAHLGYFARVTVAMAVVGGLGFWLGTAAWMAIAVFVVIQFVQPFSGVSGAALQIITPEPLRGRISAAYVMTYNAVGMAVGPSAVALFADHLASDAGLGPTIALSYLVFGVSASMLLSRGRRHQTAAMARARAATA
ncbi:MFS transporter [Stenotrophomonas sp. 24(2023)]|uniref:MFS transporter n=1 Tax=Stenotrophomonas sp. 24(2023) TaxID=3068324 RepID=UPI0027E00A07|nr:MFS transporter [Stenotrophomonas sp. 24(2023)]WMJ69352.1 MFS transporter [Stenotrophomonas sp. 24(2023)]